VRSHNKRWAGHMKRDRAVIAKCQNNDADQRFWRCLEFALSLFEIRKKKGQVRCRAMDGHRTLGRILDGRWTSVRRGMGSECSA